MIINIIPNIVTNMGTNTFVNILTIILANTSTSIIATMLTNMLISMLIIMIVDMFTSMLYNISINRSINMFERTMKQLKQRPVYFEFGVKRPVLDDWAIASKLVNSVSIIRLDDEENDMYTAIETVKKNTKKYD